MHERNILSCILAFLRRLMHKDDSILGRQHLLLMLFCYLPTIVYLLVCLMDLAGPDDAFFDYTHGIFLAVITVFLILFFRDKADVVTCLNAFTITGQSLVSMEMLYIAGSPTFENEMLIMANVVLLALNAMISMAAYLKWTTIALTIATSMTYLFCAFISQSPSLWSFAVVFIIAFSSLGTIGLLMARNYERLTSENGQLKKSEEELLSIMILSKEDIKACISLAADKHSDTESCRLIEQLDKKSRRNLLNNIGTYLQAMNYDQITVSSAFPELSASEREICRLVLQNKKLTEICTILDKTESNISTQRANIRKKLGLAHDDNLKERLLARMYEQVATPKPARHGKKRLI